jgi:hypothetical protein
MHAFLADQEDRVLRHLDDPRFRGVYIMLASALPLEEAKALKDAIVDHAADSKDHHLSDAVVQVLKTRRAVQPQLTLRAATMQERDNHGERRHGRTLSGFECGPGESAR